MKNTSLFRRVLSVILVLTMIGSLLVPMASAEPAKEEAKTRELTLTPIDPGELDSRKQDEISKESMPKAEHAATDVVRVSIVLDKASTLEAGFSTVGIANNAAAKAYRASLRADQDAMTAKIEKAIGGELDVRWNLTLAANNISANVRYGQIETIKAIEGVKDVFLENRYEPQVAKSEDEPNNGSASYMIGSNITWANGYTGAGSKVAVIDTGIDVDHKSFSGEALEYALAQNAEAKGLSYDEYVASLNLLTPESIDAVKDQLNANIGSGAAAYRSTKIGYGYNYVDKRVDYIDHMKDSQGEHGSHVEGISAANRFVKEGDEFKPALSAVGTQGVAPDAQIVTMKVFGIGGGAYDSDYMVAIEDAIVLGCDSANLSLGSGSAGFSFSNGYEQVMNKLVENGTVVAMSAGNSSGWYDVPYDGAMYPYLYTDDVNYATGGSPGSFTNTLATASVDNLGQTGMPLIFGDLSVFYSETSGYGNNPIATIAGQELGYVYFDNFGADGDGNSLLAPYADAIAGKVVLCSRGTSSFYQKVNAAAEAGAVACVIYNNQPGVINMNLTGVTTNIPAVSILQADGLAIKAQSTPVTAEDGSTYYTGTMSVAEELEVQVPEVTDTVTVSSFSSWGVPASMVLKPEILTPGGSIYSVWGANTGASSPTQSHEDYEVMSGTSMASPQTAGMAAVLGQYIRDNDLCAKTGLSQRQLINSLLMSTAHPVFDADGSYWPVIRVGAGLGNVADATNAKSYILMDESATLFPDSAKDGKVKAELGDDPERKGEYSYSFTYYPLEGKREFTLRTDIFTQWIAGNGGYGMLQDQATTLIGSETTYEINGETYEDTYAVEADVNKDGETNAADAQAILDYITGKNDGSELDLSVADLDGDKAVTSYDAKLLLEAASTPTVELSGPTKVTVNIKLDEGDKAFLLNYFTNGFYVQGYTYLDPVADEEGVLDVTHSIPIFGFCGNWSDPSMLDRSSPIDAAYGTGKRPYLANSNTNYLSVKDADGETSIYMGNPYMIEDKFPAEKLAMNSETTINAYNYLNIRNVATLGFAITDEEGNVLYAQASPAQMFAAYYYVNGAVWQNYNPRNYNVGKKLASAGVKEGDKITVSFFALPEYYGILNAKLNGEVATSGGLDTAGLKQVLEAGLVGKGAGISYTVTVDDTAPEVKGALQDLISGDIYVKASDNEYIAYVAITNKSGNQVYFETVPEQTEAGAEIEVPLELGDQKLPSEVMLVVGDYAGNEAAFKVSLGGNNEEESFAGQMFGFVPATSTAGPGSGNRVWTIDPATASVTNATTYSGVELFSNVEFNATAAEYIDEYVFAAADDGWFYVAKLDALNEASLVGRYADTVAKIYDMAYNYRNETMYVLGNDNTVYSMDLISGELAPVVKLSLPGTSGSSMEANRLAIDDNGVFYIGNYGGTSTAKLFKFEIEMPEEEEPGAPEIEGELLVSWGFETVEEFNTWTILDANADGSTWTRETGTAAFDGSAYLRNRYNSSQSVDDWAISPAIDLSEADTATVAAYLGNNATSYSENFGIYAGTSTDIASMVQILPKTNIGINGYELHTADLSAFAGEEEVYVAVRHYDSVDQFYAYLDDVAIYTAKNEEEEPGEPEPVETPELEPELVGVMGTPYNYSSGGAFAWDHNTDKLYLVTNYNTTTDTDHHLWTVDTATGKATKTNSGSNLRSSVRGLFIVPGRNAGFEPTDEPTELIVEPETLELLRGQSAELKVAVLPWTLTDKDVTFESADPTIASVKDGVVTAVNVGETVITVTTVAEPQLSAEVNVIVTLPPESELRGIIWDEEGKGQAAVFNSNATADWEALSVVGQLRWGALVGDTVYGSTDDTMYAFDADTYELTTLGGIVSMWIPSDADELPQDYRDAFAAMGYNVGPVIGPNNNGTYLTMLDPEAGSLIYFDFSEDFAGDPMALISFSHREDYTYIDWNTFTIVTDPDCAVYYLMTESGALYELLLTHDGSASPTKIADTGLDLSGVSDATNSIWASMKYDEETEYLYVSLYNGSDDYAYLYAIDANDPTRMSCTGDFRENVWPVTGLYQYEPLTDLVLKVDPTDLVVYVGDTAEINVKIKLGETNEYTAEVADPAICSFEDGIVTGLKEGETDITITTVDANEAGEQLSETVHVKVKDLASLDLTVKGQVTDAKGTRFTNILLDGPVAAGNGKPAPFDVKSGARTGDLYLAADGTKIVALDPETYEAAETDYNPDPEGMFSSYPAMDIANYPSFVDADGLYDDSKALFTTSLGWIVNPAYTGWNLSSYMPDMAAIAFGGTDEADDGTPTYVYYVLTTAGMLYQLDVKYAAGSLSISELLDTGITAADQSALSMAFVQSVNYHGDYELDIGEVGLVVANNEDQGLWFIDFATGEVEKVGSLDSTNVSGLMGSFDDLASVTDEIPEPVPEPVPSHIEGDVVAGFYFETDPEEEGWIFYDDDGDGYKWFWNQSEESYASIAGFEGLGMLMSNSYVNNVGALSPDNWAFSPVVDLTGAAEDVTLAFWAKGQDPDWADEHFAVYVQVSGAETMTQVIPETVATGDWIQYTVSLADFIGQQISVGFRHYNVTDMYVLDLDQVEILENVVLVEGEDPEPEPEPISGEALYKWSFEDADEFAAWTNVDADNDGYGWQRASVLMAGYNIPAYDGADCICSQSYDNNYGPLTPNNWFVSPAIDLSEVDGAVALSVYAMGQDASYAAEKFALYAGTSADIASMTKVGGDFTTGGTWAQYTADLSDFAGNAAVYVAIRHYNVTDMFYLDVDNVEIIVAGADDGNAVKNVPAKTYTAVPLNINRVQLGDGMAMANAILAPAAIEMTSFAPNTSATAANGGLNAVKGEIVNVRALVDDTANEEGNVKVVLCEDVAVTNGLIKISYDPEILTFVDALSDVELYSINEAEGVICFAYAAVEEIPAETALATLNFTYSTEENVDTEITVETLERCDDVAVEEEALVIPVVYEKPEEPVEHDCPCKEFSDMPEYGTVEHTAIDWAFTHEPQITNGTGDGMFHPERQLMRSEAVTFLWRAAGCPEPASSENPFSDVPNDSWFVKAVLWAVEKGITNGTGNGKFSPEMTLDTGMMLTFLYRQQGKPAVENEHSYDDVPEWYAEGVSWAVENKIAAPKSETEFGSAEPSTRADTVVYLYRVYEHDMLVE